MQKNMFKVLLILVLAGLLIFSGCQKVEEPSPAPGPTPTPAPAPTPEPEPNGEEPEEPAEPTPTPTPTPGPTPAPEPAPEPEKPEKPAEPVFNAQADYDKYIIVNDEKGYTNADARRFKFFVDTFSEEFAVIIDASPVNIYQESHIPKAINIPAVNIWDNLDKLSKEKNILVYGQNDKQSLYVTKVLSDNGFPYIFRLQGNFGAWIERDYPTERVITQGDINNLKSIIANLPDGSEKQEMEERLRVLQANLDLQEPVKTVEGLAAALDQTGKATQDDIDRAKSAYETTRQLALEKQIDIRDSEIIQRLAKAEALIASAENQKNILEAREAITAIETESDAEYARILVSKIADEDLKEIMYNEIRAKVRTEEEADAVDTAMSLAESLRRDGSDTQETINRVKAAYEIATKFLAESEDPENLKSIKEAKLMRTINLINEAQDALDIKNAKELLEELGI
jgi:rhodanese-related sulfurtransferase